MHFLINLSAALLFISTATALAEGDPLKGEKVFKKCKTCHEIGEGAKNKLGPTLNGIVGDAAGKNPDFKYSKALMAKAKEGLIWDQVSLAAYIAKPKKFVKGTKMSFAGIKKKQQITDLIAYLKNFEQVE